MGTTLYLLRQHPDHISSSIFQASDEGMDIVFIEQAAAVAPPSMKGLLVAGDGMVGGLAHMKMTYEELVEKIFSSEHVIIV